MNFDDHIDAELIKRNEFEFLQSVIKSYDKTTAAEFNVHSKSVYYSKTSLWIFNSENELRKWALWLIEWR
jgi:hypothetical protein